MSVSLVPAVHIFGCGCEVCCSQMSPPSLSSSHLWDLQCGEAPESLNTQTGVDQWWFGSQSHCIPYCAWWAHHCQGLLKHSGGPWFKHCTLPCISMITHQYTNQDLWQNGLMNMKVKLNILSHFGGILEDCIFLHQHHIVTWSLKPRGMA